MLADAANQFHMRLHVIQEALSSPKEWTALIGQLQHHFLLPQCFQQSEIELTFSH